MWVVVLVANLVGTAGFAAAAAWTEAFDPHVRTVFAEIGREYSRAEVGVLFVPAWDFTRDARLHSRVAVMRGVEGGFSVARSAANGLLTSFHSPRSALVRPQARPIPFRPLAGRPSSSAGSG